MFNLIIYIGRFEPPHNGHFSTIRKALEQTEKLLIFIGSHEVCRSLKNPFTSEERIEMLKISLNETELKKIIFVPIHDSNYDYKEWVKELKKMYCLHFQPSAMPRIGIIGHKKDNTSYYLDLFSEWELVEMPLLEGGISSTEIRKKWFSSTLREEDKIPLSVYSYLKNKERESWAKNLKNEYELVEEYKQAWTSAPYPPIFVAGDALVTCKEHILLIKRGAFPGKGLFGMAGGFLEHDEPIRQCAIRELMEETGIELSYKELDKSIKGYQIFDDPEREPRGRMISHTFIFDLQISELPKLRAADDASAAVWILLKDLDGIRSQFAGDHYKIIKKCLSL